MSTLTTRILRRTELRRDTPLSKVIESFFIHNGMAAKTKEFYRANFNAYAAWLKKRIDQEPTLADLDGDYVSAYLRELETKPTAKYPEGSPFRARVLAHRVPAERKAGRAARRPGRGSRTGARRG